MMMRCALTCLVAMGLCGLVIGSAQADQGMLSQSTLSAMGLSGMQVMSDSDAMEIRGHGYDPWRGHGKKAKNMALAWGYSYAHVHKGKGVAHTKDGFKAKGKHKASGKHLSKAGYVVKHRPKRRGGGGPNTLGVPPGGGGGKPPKPPVKHKVVVFAGGFSHASVH